MTDGSGSTTWTYDPRGRVVTETKTINGGGSFTTQYTYDSIDRVVTMKYPDNETVTHTYNDQGALKGLSGTDTYASNIAYNAQGQITALPLGNGLTTGYTYDPLNFCLQRVQVGPSGSLLNPGYTYDSVGNVATITDSKNNNQVQNFTYDPNGNMTGRTENGQTYTQLFNEENRLKQVTGGANVTFTYDGDGNRVKKVEGSTTTYYVGGYYEKQGSTITKYYYAGGQRIAMRKGSVVYYLHGDHLGSTSLTTCGSGTTCGGNGTEVPGSRTLYYPYGEVRWPTGGSTLPTDYTFTGQRNESSFKLMDYNARYYDPYLNRFIQADTIVPSPANPQSLNRYSYVLNSPLRYTDPTGHAHWVGEDGDTVPRVYTNPQQRQTLQGNSTLSAASTLGSSTLQSVSTPTSYRANQSSNGYYWTTPSKLPNDAGVIMRYQTHFEAVPKVATVYAPCIQGPELQTVWRYESGQWIRSQEVHFAMSVDVGISLGVDNYGGSTSPELGVGPIVWGGNELVVEGKIHGSGVEAGFEYGSAGDFFVITTGEKFNQMGINEIQRTYIQRDAMLLGYEVYENYGKAWNAFWLRNLAQQGQTGFPYDWLSTEME